MKNPYRMTNGVYILRTTLLNAVFVPAALPLIPELLLLMLPFVFLFLIPLSGAILIFWMYKQYFQVYLIEFEKDFRNGNMPESFTVLLLPFYLPLFYIFVLSMLAFWAASPSLIEPPGSPALLFLGALPYLGWTTLCIAAAGTYTDPTVMIVCCLSFLQFLVAVWGTVYVYIHSPASIPRRNGLLLMTGITVLLAVLTYNSYLYYKSHTVYVFLFL